MIYPVTLLISIFTANADNICLIYLQFREFLSSYNRLSEMCFIDCVHDMTTRKVLDSEVMFSAVTAFY